jgi:hypothetical protein
MTKKFNTYLDCSVCEEWHNYQSFCEWFDENYYTIEGENVALDKDILHKGNKIYSPENCCFVPQSINSLFTKNDVVRGNLPIGVRMMGNRYNARISIKNKEVKKKKHLGMFDTPEDAFYNGYKPFKEQYIKQEAERYKNIIPNILYEALCKYEVQITD